MNALAAEVKVGRAVMAFTYFDGANRYQTAAPRLQTGSPNGSCQWGCSGGQCNTPLPPTPSPAPTITGITGLLQSGGTSTITINGNNFGNVNGALGFCPWGASPCQAIPTDGTPMSYSYTSWTNTQIVASIALPSTVTEADWGVYVISDAWVLGSAAANPQDVEVPVEPPPTLTISLGGSSNAIALLNPVQTISAIVTPDGTSAIVELNALGAGGRVSISPPSPYLENGIPQTVTITPLQVSQAPFDVQITGSLDGQTLATANMTVVQITLPPITHPDTPAGMPNRIPECAATPITISVAPNLQGSGQSVILAAINAGGQYGSFAIDGGQSEAITSTNTYMIRGTAQTAATSPPGGGNAGQSAIAAFIGGAKRGSECGV